MSERRVISVDIGSTWTKAGLFLLTDSAVRVVARSAAPTTPDDLTQGFAQAVAPLLGLPSSTPFDDLPTEPPWVFCSSAKGGLRIAAVGLTRDLTLRAARLTATSAGGKVTAAYAYRLTPEDLAALAACPPDIILLCGGTDGGNERVPLENARALARLRLSSVVLFAGNRSISREVATALGEGDVRITENLMPEVGVFRPEPAREAIRQIYLDRIVIGKGLDSIRQRAGSAPRPTPLAVYELVQAVAALGGQWRRLCVVDLGGATTDVYSCVEGESDSRARVVGLPEPPMKRTVEGDLGLRVNALSLAQEAEALPGFCASPEADDARGVARAAAAHPAWLSAAPADRRGERLLACAAVALALSRHAGRLREVWSPEGKGFLLYGKDLRRTALLVGTGGCLARSDAAFADDALRLAPAEDRGLVLLPERPSYQIDAAYVWPLLGNIVPLAPLATARLAVESLSVPLPFHPENSA